MRTALRHLLASETLVSAFRAFLILTCICVLQHSFLPNLFMLYFLFTQTRPWLLLSQKRHPSPPPKKRKQSGVGWVGELAWWVKVLAQGTELGSLEATKDRHLGLASVIPALCQNSAGRDRKENLQ